MNEYANQLFISRHVYGAADFYPTFSDSMLITLSFPSLSQASTPINMPPTAVRLFHPADPREPHLSIAVRAASLVYYYSLSLSPNTL